MATLERSASAAGPDSLVAAAVEGWRAFHIFHHSDREGVILDLVWPLVEELGRAGLIDSFFFVRYSLGGTHVRLRLRVVSGGEAEVEEVAGRRTAEFLRCRPSSGRPDSAEIRRRNVAILQHEAGLELDEIHPDNSLLAAPFWPEVERYGGERFLPASLDFFTLSSLLAFRYLRANRESVHGQRLAAALRILLRQLWSFSTDRREAREVLRSYVSNRGLDALQAPAEQAYLRRREAYLGLVGGELDALRDGTRGRELEVEGARRLAGVLRQASGPVRCRVGEGQLHMTANRLGVSNPEEVYLGRILERALDDLEDDGSGPLRDGAGSPVQRDRDLRDLEELRRRAMRGLFQAPG